MERAATDIFCKFSVLTKQGTLEAKGTALSLCIFRAIVCLRHQQEQLCLMFQGLEKRKACFLEHSSPCLSCTGTSKMVLHAFQDCCVITTLAMRDLKPIFAPRLYQSERGLSTTGIWPLARRLKLCFSSKF